MVLLRCMGNRRALGVRPTRQPTIVTTPNTGSKRVVPNYHAVRLEIGDAVNAVELLEAPAAFPGAAMTLPPRRQIPRRIGVEGAFEVGPARV
jgi:hypothetical protein